MRSLLFILLVLFLSGCATSLTIYVGRQNERYSLSEGIYPATKLDAMVLSYAPEAWRNESKLECIVETPLIVLDLPFSLVFDTLLLPYDLISK